MNNKWEVDIKGGPGSTSFEISVIRSYNDHGKASYGWFDTHKLLISHSGGPCHNPIYEPIWSQLVELAEKVKNDLNAEIA